MRRRDRGIKCQRKAGRDEDRYRGGGEEAETSEALPLVKTHSDTEQDCALGNCRHLAEAVLLRFFFFTPPPSFIVV